MQCFSRCSLRLCAVTLVLLASAAVERLPAQVQKPRPLVDRLSIQDTIQPVTAGRLDRALALAENDHAQALLVQLDTPGGLLDSTRQMVGSILSSPIPVILYIAPSGARAGSAGFFLLESADVAAMAPGTNAGAAHPVLGGGTPDATMRQKIENDAAAFLRSYVSSRGRNATAAEDGVRNSRSWSADEAMEQHLIETIAPNDRDLLAALDGKTIRRINGTEVTLHLKDAEIRTIEPSTREQLLGYLINPNLALFILVAGALLIYLEFNTPGTIVPGAVGTVMVMLAIFSLNLLPIRHTAVLLLLAALVLMLLEMKFASHGALALAAIACLVFGTLTLVDAPVPGLSVQPALAVGLSLAFGFISLFLLRLAIRARRSKSLMGPAALVGFPATAMEPLSSGLSIQDRAPSELGESHTLGHILVQGEIWQATSTEPVSKEARVRVIGFEGDILKVRPVTEMLS